MERNSSIDATKIILLWLVCLGHMMQCGNYNMSSASDAFYRFVYTFHLRLGKYQMRNSSSLIAMAAITAMQYNILSTAKRFSDYETNGGLFMDATKGSVDLLSLRESGI